MPGSGIVPFIDGHDLRTLNVGAQRMHGLSPFEAAVVARMLQGWEPPPVDTSLRLQASDLRPGEWRGYTPLAPGTREDPLPSVPVTLPGGSWPVCESWQLDEFRSLPGIPLLVDDGIGCCALYVRVSGSNSQPTWDIDGTIIEFTPVGYARGIQQLLVLAGEEPGLIGNGSIGR